MDYRLPLYLGVEAIEKGAFGSSSTSVANFTYLIDKYSLYQHLHSTLIP